MRVRAERMFLGGRRGMRAADTPTSREDRAVYDLVVKKSNLAVAQAVSSS